LNGLPVEYNHFKSHIRARPVSLTLAELRTLLLAEEQDIAAAASHSNPPVLTAMMAKSTEVPVHQSNQQSLNSSPDGGHWHNNQGGYNGSSNWHNGSSHWNNRGHHSGGNRNYRGGQNRNYNGGRYNNRFHGGRFNNRGNFNGGYNPFQDHNSNYNGGYNGSGFHNSCPSNGGGGYQPGGYTVGYNSSAQSFNPSGFPPSAPPPPQYIVPPNPSQGILGSPTTSVTSPLQACQLCNDPTHTAASCPQFQHVKNQAQAYTASSSFQFADPNVWLADTGATHHVTNDLGNLNSAKPCTSKEGITVGNGASLSVVNAGTAFLNCCGTSFKLANVLHVPKIAQNLLSVYQFCLENRCQMLFDAFYFLIQDKLGRILYKGLSSDGLYPVPLKSKLFTSQGRAVAYLGKKVSSLLWHKRLGHPANEVLVHMLTKSHESCHVDHEPSVCQSCLEGKMSRLPFSLSETRSSEAFHRIHSDVWGPSPCTSISGYRYYVIFVDDCTRYTWVYPLINKSDVFGIFVKFHAYISTFFHKHIKIFQSDGGGEFVNTAMRDFLAKHGILHYKSCPHTPQQNGLAERKHRHLVDTALTLLSTASMPLKFWFHAVSTANFLINRMCTKVLNWDSPYNKLYISRHVIFDENVFPFATIKANTVHPLPMPFSSSVTPLYTSPIRADLPPTITASLHDRGENISDRGGTSGNAEIGINGNGGVSASAGHGIDGASVNPDNGNDDHGVGIGSGGVDEGNTHVGSNDNCHNVVDNGIFIPVALPLTIPHADTGSNSFHPTTSNVHPMITRSKVGVSKKKKVFAASKKVFSVISSSKDDTIQEPKTYKQALQSPEWFAAMKEEFDALHKQNTWSLVPLPSHRTVVGCKWIFKVKKNADGSVARFKARLVAKGYHQEEGIDYTETFSPVVKHTTVRLILALATQFTWKLKQLDVKNAFLHGILTEEVYMDQPPGFVDQGSPRMSFSDPALFIYNKGSILMFLLLYVDDIILTGNNQVAIDKLILTLGAEFDMKDLGELSYFLGLQIQHTSSGLFVNQAKYASELLAKMNMQTCATVPTPMLPGTKLYKNDGELLDNPSLYRSIVGALQYLTFSRPDIAYAVNYACQFLQQPTTTHLIAVKRILRYIQGTLDYGIQFTSGFLELQAYTDADWAGDPNDRRSTSGYVVFLGRNPISWGAKKQTTVSRSSTEAEYRSLANSACELVWLKQLLQEIHITLRKPPVIWCDNISAIALAHNPVFHSKTRHMEIDVHFVRERVQRKEMQVCHLSSTEQLGDILTKSLAAPQFQYLRNNLMLGKPRMSLQGGNS
ncbi:unnamed protein product, partial [Prunus brigantina]